MVTRLYQPRNLLRATLTAAALAGGIGAMPALHAQTITAVMHAPVRTVDPNITTAYIVRDYAYMIYDTLLATDANGKIQPQMAEKWTVSPDGKTYTFTLRDGLKWHDGTPVTADDCVASINRWAKFDKIGQVMMTLTSGIDVVDAKTFTIKLNMPSELPLKALGKPSGIAAFMMPKRVAMTPPGEQIKETIGSGPFKFVTAEYKPGVQVVFEKNKDYVPRKEAASGMAGGKVVKVDRVKWVTMPDEMTAVSALNNNEIDFIEQAPPDLLPMLQSNSDITLTQYPLQGGQNVARLNFTQPPFNNKLIRQAALLAVDQKEVLQAQIGNEKLYKICAAVVSCSSPMRSDIGADTVIKGQPEKAAALLKEAKYDGTPVVILQPTDIAKLGTPPTVIAAQLRKAGFNVQLQAMDWATVGMRRASMEAPSKGGWNIFFTFNVIPDVSDPLGFIALAANGKGAWFGWPDVPAMEEVRKKIAVTTDPAQLKKLGDDVQRIAVDEVLMIPAGEFTTTTAKRKTLTGQLDAAVPVFWNMTKGGK